MKTCTTCGCTEERGCVVEAHGRPWPCYLTTHDGRDICSLCLSREGYIDMRGGHIRDNLVSLALELHGVAGVREIAEKYNAPEARRVLAALDRPCAVCRPGDAP